MKEDSRYARSRKSYWREMESHLMYTFKLAVFPAKPVSKLDRLIEERRTKRTPRRRPRLVFEKKEE
jgi:hypothetical protein